MKIGEYDDGYPSDEPEEPKASARAVFINGPMDGMILDWTNGGDFPEEIAFKWTNRTMDESNQTITVYAALDFYQDGEKLEDGIPCRETQSYFQLKTISGKCKSLETIWDEAGDVVSETE